MSEVETVSDEAKGRRAQVKLGRTKKRRPRSAVTSGRKAFVNGDPNSAWARRFHDLVLGHVADAGGRDVLSEAQFALCKRAAGLECELEQMEGRMSLGERVDLDRYGRAASHLRRILESLGLERKPRDVTQAAQEADEEFRQQILAALAENDAGEEARTE